MILDHFFLYWREELSQVYHRFDFAVETNESEQRRGGGRFIQRNQSMKFIKEIKKTNSYFCWLLSASFQWLFSSRIQIDESI